MNLAPPAMCRVASCWRNQGVYGAPHPEHDVRADQQAVLSGQRIVPPSPEGQALVDVLVTCLSVRAGETLTPELIRERAAGAAQVLNSAYQMLAKTCPDCEWAMTDCICKETT
jgi:Flp pilus assembly protein CpaB